MNAVIIEDEKPAVEKLTAMLAKYDPEINVAGVFSSILESVDWFEKKGQETDLIFMDIQLSDGNSFEIFEQVEINKPVIFITAYDEYAMKAFRVNSIDYLLKPLQYDDFYRSMEKIKLMRENLPANREVGQYEELSRLLLQLNKNYKDRFLVKVGDHLRSVKAEHIAFFYAEGRTVFLYTQKQNKYIVDYTLEELDSQIDPNMFFRPNRSFIVNINAIRDVVVYSNSRLLIDLHSSFEKEIIVSREKVARLKTWFEGLK